MALQTLRHDDEALLVLQMLRHDDEVLLVLQMLKHDDAVLLVLQMLSTPDCSLDRSDDRSLDRSHSSHFFLQQDDVYRIYSSSPCQRTRDPSYHHGCQIRDNEVYLCCSDCWY